ncbi:MAG: Gfo/Idh/MocA family oxidoreductase [Clostridia bacterium]|nr:Gfo/Idh/MocA family oxidoreductase [Clostridia bacterium]
MKKIKIGVLGAYRGTSMINYCKRANNAEVVAICDKAPEAIETQKKFAEGLDITYYDNFEDFIKHDMDAVVLANYAHQHAPFAIRAMKEGKHVFSEVLPVQHMKEAVELVEAVEETGMIYAYGENYCYMPSTYEMKKLYENGEIGELEYAECDYLHNCESIWASITYGERDHWRNNKYAAFYCTHSLGPIIHITGLRPVKVVGLEGLKNKRNLRVGAKGAQFAIEMVTFENDAIVKSTHGNLYKDSIWYSLYGDKGRIESAREDAMNEGYYHLYVNTDDYDGQYKTPEIKYYKPELPDAECARGFGHGGSDFYSMWHFVEKIKGNPDADIIDVYESLDMALPGMFAYLSILDGGVPKEIPNLRDKSERDKWRNFTACTDPEAAGDMLLPPCSTGVPDISDEVYKKMYDKWQAELQSDSGYIAAAFSQGSEDSQFNR